MKAYRGSRDTSPVIPKYGCRWRWEVIKPRPLYPREITPVPVGGWVDPRAGRVFSWKKQKSLVPARVMVISDISKLRHSVHKLLGGWNADVIGVYLAFIVQGNWTKYFSHCRVIARHVLVVHRMCEQRSVLFVYMWPAKYCLLRHYKCLEMYALPKRRIPHSLAHIPTIANGYVVRIWTVHRTTIHWLQRRRWLDTPVTLVGT
jgi:hypothetical protein